jgi:hypothetical protein
MGNMMMIMSEVVIIALKDADLDVAISDTDSAKDASRKAVQKIEAMDMDMGMQATNFAHTHAYYIWHRTCVLPAVYSL